MAESNLTKHQAIVLDFIAKLKTILVSNNYKTDFGKKVEHWADEVNAKEVDELIIVSDGAVEVDQGREDSDGIEDVETNVLSVELTLGAARKTNIWKYLTDGISDIKTLISLNENYFSKIYGGVQFSVVSFGVDTILAVPFKHGEAFVSLAITFYTNHLNEDEDEYTV